MGTSLRVGRALALGEPEGGALDDGAGLVEGSSVRGKSLLKIDVGEFDAEGPLVDGASVGFGVLEVGGGPV